jgi:predicted RNase H-like HicB family nuclease
MLERDEDGMYIASVPALRGCYTQGATRKEALENVRDAIRLHIKARKQVSEPIPAEVGVTKVRVVA